LIENPLGPILQNTNTFKAVVTLEKFIVEIKSKNASNSKTGQLLFCTIGFFREKLMKNPVEY
jgi:hypothetical protein